MRTAYKGTYEEIILNQEAAKRFATSIQIVVAKGAYGIRMRLNAKNSTHASYGLCMVFEHNSLAAKNLYDRSNSICRGIPTQKPESDVE